MQGSFVVRLFALLFAALGTARPVPAAAQGFSAVVSPPRFEVTAKPGQTYRDVVEITNVSPQPSKLAVKTADWRLDASNAVIFTDELAADSCRPWVALESRELALGANGRHRFRFEIAVPKEAPARECRFALMFEGATQEVKTGGLQLPISGRIGVIVYIGVGEVSSALSLQGYGRQVVNGAQLPSLKIANRGSAHGRLEGFVEGTDAVGNTFTLVPATFPILPGEEREIALSFDEGAKKKKKTPALAPRYPMTLRGQVYDGHTAIDVNTIFTP